MSHWEQEGKTLDERFRQSQESLQVGMAALEAAAVTRDLKLIQTAAGVLVLRLHHCQSAVLALMNFLSRRIEDEGTEQTDAPPGGEEAA